jgi:hypothetical protein
MHQSLPVRAWAYRTQDPEFLSIQADTVDRLYELRVSWLESKFIADCKRRAADTTEILGGIAARRAREAYCHQLRERRNSNGFGSVPARLAAIAVSKLAPPESLDVIEVWRQFLCDRLYSYADWLIDNGTLARQAISDFEQHADELLRNISGFRWKHWSGRLKYPESERHDLVVVLTSAADRLRIEIEERIWDANTSTLPDAHLTRLARLRAHIERAKLTGSGFTSKAAFYRNLRIDRSDYYKWEARKLLNAPAYADRIERAIDKLPN